MNNTTLAGKYSVHELSSIFRFEVHNYCFHAVYFGGLLNNHKLKTFAALTVDNEQWVEILKERLAHLLMFSSTEQLDSQPYCGLLFSLNHVRANTKKKNDTCKLYNNLREK